MLPVSKNPEPSFPRRPRRGPSERLWAAVGLAASVVTVSAGLVADFIGAAGLVANLDRRVAAGAIAGAGTVAFLAATLISRRGVKRAELAAARSRQAFSEAAAQVVLSVEQANATPEASLEDELSEVSTSLSAAVTRLRQISAKADAFEAEVKDMVARADSAKATASLHEEDARRIASFLGAESEARFRDEIAKLVTEHNKQIEQLHRSSSRTALWTFIGGVVLGIVGNVVVALLVG